MLFSSLPPPKASVKVAMSTFNSSSNPCWANGRVTMYDHSLKDIQNIKKGDKVMTKNNNYAEVLCVIKTIFPEKRTTLVDLPCGLVITPYHPVMLENQMWSFPCDIVEGKEQYCDAVYNLVLDKDHVININGITSCTLGHGLTQPVVEHPYFGTHRVINDLMKLSGWDRGQVILRAGCMQKRDKKGLICGILPSFCISV